MQTMDEAALKAFGGDLGKALDAAATDEAVALAKEASADPMMSQMGLSEASTMGSIDHKAIDGWITSKPLIKDILRGGK